MTEVQLHFGFDSSAPVSEQHKPICGEPLTRARRKTGQWGLQSSTRGLRFAAAGLQLWKGLPQTEPASSLSCWHAHFKHHFPRSAQNQDRLQGQNPQHSTPAQKTQREVLPVAWAAPIILPRISPSRFVFLITLTFPGRSFWANSSSSPFKSSENKESHNYSHHVRHIQRTFYSYSKVVSGICNNKLSSKYYRIFLCFILKESRRLSCERKKRNEA